MKYNGRKYLQKLGINIKNTPWGWCEDKKHNQRKKEWKKQRKIYGFDSRETWSLNYTIAILVYERLSMYNEVNIIDTSFHKIKYKRKTMTLQECIDFILDNLKDYILDSHLENEEENMNKAMNAMELLSKIYPYLWW